MGNKNNHISSDHSQNRPNYSKLSKIYKRISPKCSNKRRVVFVSLIGLYRCYKSVPSEILNNCLLLLPLKQIWIYQPFKYVDELRSNVISQLTTFSDTTETQKFIDMIKFKDSQGLVCWMLDYIGQDKYPMYCSSQDEKYPNHSDINPLIASFWYYFSTKLTTLTDPCNNGCKYKPLILDQKWWKNKNQFVSKFDVTTSAILTELYFLTMKYCTMQEIISQSNPTLNPIIAYENIMCNEMNPITNVGILKLYGSQISQAELEKIDVNNEKSVWYISADYDPNDI